MTRTGFEAIAAAPLGIEIPVTEHIPVPSDQDLAAGMAVSTGTLVVMDVSQIDMVDPIGKCDFTGSNQGLMRRFFDIRHFPVRVKCAEMEGYLWTQLFHHPAAQFFQFTTGIIVSRDEQGCDLEPDFGFVFQVFQGIEHRG